MKTLLLVLATLIGTQSAHALSWTCGYLVNDQEQQDSLFYKDCVKDTISSLKKLGCSIDLKSTSVSSSFYSGIDRDTNLEYFSKYLHVTVSSQNCLGPIAETYQGHVELRVETCNRDEQRFDVQVKPMASRFRKDFSSRVGVEMGSPGADFFCKKP